MSPTAPAPVSAQRHRGRWIAIGVGAVVAVLGVVLALTVGTVPVEQQRQSRLLGEGSPAFELPTLTGPTMTLEALAGKAVIVNFWNTWCIPCHQELPALKVFYARHASEPDFAMVGIVRDDTKSAVRKYVQRESMQWIIAFDPGSQAAVDFGTRGQPETFAISSSGQIVGFQWGPSTVSGLEAMLDTARRSA